VRDSLTLNIDYIVDHAHGEMERVKILFNILSSHGARQSVPIFTAEDTFQTQACQSEVYGGLVTL
jgi:hypothetical protein